MVNTAISFLPEKDTGLHAQQTETACLRKEIFSLKLLEETLHSFQTDITPQEIKEQLEVK